MQHVLSNIIPYVPIAALVLAVAFVIYKSVVYIGPNQFGLVIKTYSRKKLHDGQLIAFNGEAGYQSELLSSNWHIKLWPFYRVIKRSVPQVGGDSIGLVIAQVGEPLPAGAKTAVDKEEVFKDFTNLRAFLENGGQRGLQRRVVAPNETVLLHPIAFMLVTPEGDIGISLSKEMDKMLQGIDRKKLRPVDIPTDHIGVVTSLEGGPQGANDIASRLGDYQDVADMEAANSPIEEIIEAITGSKNGLHNNYQNFQMFLDAGGRLGLQHDTLLPARYLLNPYCVSVDVRPMLVVEQGEVAVVKSYVGQPMVDTSGTDYKFGALVTAGHRGVWAEPLRTGKYALNPHLYEAQIVQTSILNLNWAKAQSAAHDLDAALSPIEARTSDGFVFTMDLQVLIHVPDTMAPRIICMVKTMRNLVDEVLQPAVGNYFRDSMQRLKAIDFIEKRGDVQVAAQEFIKGVLSQYQVETRGVYIQAVDFPDELIKILSDRELATQKKATFEQQQAAEQARIQLEQTSGTANAQKELAQAQVSIEVESARAKAVAAAAEGRAVETRLIGEADADRIKAIGTAEAAAIEAKGLASAAGYEAQKLAIGPEQTAAVAVLHEIGVNGVNVMPQVLVNSGASGTGTADAIMALVASGLSAGTAPAVRPAPVATLIAPASAVKTDSTDGDDATPDDGMNN